LGLLERLRWWRERFHHEGTKDTKEGIQRQGAKDAKAGFARVKTFDIRR
jgi:hypothetical protein